MNKLGAIVLAVAIVFISVVEVGQLFNPPGTVQVAREGWPSPRREGSGTRFVGVVSYA